MSLVPAEQFGCHATWAKPTFADLCPSMLVSIGALRSRGFGRCLSNARVLPRAVGGAAARKTRERHGMFGASRAPSALKMKPVLSLIAATSALLLILPITAGAQGLSLRIDDGLVTLTAQNVPLREILERWSELADVTIVNSEALPATPV